MTSSLFKNEAEENHHKNAVQVLCEEYPDYSQFIHDIYLELLSASLPTATIRSYLPIFISRRVRARIKKKIIDNAH